MTSLAGGCCARGDPLRDAAVGDGAGQPGVSLRGRAFRVSAREAPAIPEVEVAASNWSGNGGCDRVNSVGIRALRVGIPCVPDCIYMSCTEAAIEVQSPAVVVAKHVLTRI